MSSDKEFDLSSEQDNFKSDLKTYAVLINLLINPLEG